LEFIELTADVRDRFGKGPSRTLRREGKVPAVFYGRKAAPIHLSLDANYLGKMLRDGGSSQVIRLTIQDGVKTTKTVMFKEIQTHPLSMDLVHADLYEISMDRKITVSVPVNTVVTEGEECRGVEEGGILQIIRRELEISCLPNQIPDSIDIDITDMGIGDAIHIEEIDLPEGVEVDADTNFTVVSVSAPMKEELPEEEEEAEALEEGEEGEEGEGEEGAEGGEAEGDKEG
jgi:large subunit ribosomal protein L25